MCKEIWDNSQTIGLLVNCNEYGNRCRTTHFFKVKKMIGWQVDCKECGKRYVKRQNLKIHKFLDDESIAMNGKRCRAMHNLKIYK